MLRRRGAHEQRSCSCEASSPFPLQATWPSRLLRDLFPLANARIESSCQCEAFRVLFISSHAFFPLSARSCALPMLLSVPGLPLPSSLGVAPFPLRPCLPWGVFSCAPPLLLVLFPQATLLVRPFLLVLLPSPLPSPLFPSHLFFFCPPLFSGALFRGPFSRPSGASSFRRPPPPSASRPSLAARTLAPLRVGAHDSVSDFVAMVNERGARRRAHGRTGGR